MEVGALENHILAEIYIYYSSGLSALMGVKIGYLWLSELKRVNKTQRLWYVGIFLKLQLLAPIILKKELVLLQRYLYIRTDVDLVDNIHDGY